MNTVILNRSNTQLTTSRQTPITITDFETIWPGGYARLRGMADLSALPHPTLLDAYRLQLWDGNLLIYDGTLEPLRVIKGSTEKVSFMAWGFYKLLKDRKLNKVWIDTAVVSSLKPPVTYVDYDPPFVVRKDDNVFEFTAVSTVDVTRNSSDIHKEEYNLAPGNYIRRVTYDYTIRSGEGFNVILYNVDQAATEDTETVTSSSPTSGSVDHTFTQGNTSSMELRISPRVTDLYAYDDYVIITNLTVYATMANFGSPTYTGGEVIQDIIYLLADGEISSDFSLITDPAQVLSPFRTLGFEAGAASAARVAAHSDTSDNIYGLAVWGGQTSSDGLPQAEFSYVDTSVADYRVSILECDQFQDYGSVEMANYVVIAYQDTRNVTLYRTPINNTDLQNAASIAAYGRKDSPVFNIGPSTAAFADAVGEQYLATFGGLSSALELQISHSITNAHGVRVPVSRVRAGQCLKITDWPNSGSYWIYSTRYNVEDDSLFLSLIPTINPVSGITQNARIGLA